MGNGEVEQANPPLLMARGFQSRRESSERSPRHMAPGLRTPLASAR
jgi:hypothetical protein